MHEEIYPWVDINGKVIGKYPRSRFHDGSMLLHPVIHLHIFNPLGELYLQKRSSTREIFPGLWDSSVGGHINFGESPEHAVVRESLEELNFAEFDVRFILRHIIETGQQAEFTYCYFTVTEQLPQPDGIEVADGRFWTLDEIRENLGENVFTPNFEQDFSAFLYKGLQELIS